MSFITSKDFLVICALFLFASPALVAMKRSLSSSDLERRRYHAKNEELRVRCYRCVALPAAMGCLLPLVSIFTFGMSFVPGGGLAAKVIFGSSACFTEALSCCLEGVALWNCYKIYKKAPEFPLEAPEMNP